MASRPPGVRATKLRQTPENKIALSSTTQSVRDPSRISKVGARNYIPRDIVI